MAIVWFTNISVWITNNAGAANNIIAAGVDVTMHPQLGHGFKN